MQLCIQYTNEQLDKIRDQGFIYMCACPSQVSEQIAHLRRLFAYQFNCMNNVESEMVFDMKTHEMIAEATHQAHEIMQKCLHDVLIHEKWDLETLEMPANLRKHLEQILTE
ncbi:MAG: hypothetical protein WBI40_05845 [Methylococcaceae bacterium]